MKAKVTETGLDPKTNLFYCNLTIAVTKEEMNELLTKTDKNLELDINY